MINHPSGESIMIFDSLIDPQNAEELKRTKTDIENNITKIRKLIKNENQNKKGGNPRHSKKDAELVGLTEDLHKQSQSLYALYDSVFEKVVSHTRNTKPSLSSSDSDSDSEYFSSEELHDDSNNNKTNEVLPLKTETSAKETDLSEGKFTTLMEEMRSLSQQKMNQELQIESQANEVKQMSVKNTELQDQVKELELLLKDKQGVVFNLEEKLSNNEDQTKSNIENLMAQISELEEETISLRTKKDEMEEKIKFDNNEVSSQLEDMMEQLNVLQQKLDSLVNQNKELEAQMETKGQKMFQYVIEIGTLKESLAEMRSSKETMMKEKEGFVVKIKDLELELETRRNHENELEEKLGDTSYEIKQLKNENKALQDRNNELKAAMTQRGEEISDFLKDNESNENGVLKLKAEVNAMRLELDTLHEQKTKREHQNERNQKEYAESLAKIENLNTMLASQVADQEKENTMMLNKFRLSQRSAERKMEELTEEFRKKMEDNIRLLHQRIHVAEQLNNENKNSCRLTKERYEEENRLLGEKVTSYEEELTMLKGVGGGPTINGFEFFEDALNRLNVVTEMVEEQRECVMKSVSKMLCEVQFTKDWIRKKNEEMKQVKENELLLRDKVWNLEAEVSRGGGEKLNLTNAVSQLEKKVGKLEKNLKEKDEELVSLGEKKREAIRQLCVVVEFHRERCNYLRTLVTSMKVVNKKT